MLRILMLCGPSGAGKGTLVRRLLAEFPDRVALSVSSTTRNPREGEVDGVHYNFVSKDSFEAKLKDDFFLESANVHGNYYGTSYDAVKKICEQDKVCILEIDVQGVQKVLDKGFGEGSRKILHVAPPDFEVLEARLRARGTETEDQIKVRLENARSESEWLEENGRADAKIINNDRDEASNELITLVKQWFPDVLK